MKKIFFYIKHLNIGGAEKVLIEILQNIDTSKFNITLILRSKIEEENILIKNIPSVINIESIIPDELAKKNFKYKDIKKNFIQKIYYKYIKILLQHSEKKFFEKMKKEKYDIGINFDVDYAYIKKIMAKKYVGWIHNSLKERLKNNKERLLKKTNELKKYDKIIALCDDMMADMKEIFPDLAHLFERIYNPFNFQRIYNASEKFFELRGKEKEIIDKIEYIVSVKRLEKTAKDFETLFKGFKLYKSKYKNDLKLVLIGDGPNRKEIEKLIEKYEIEKEIILLGGLKNPYPIIKRSKFLVHSSKSEGLPTVLIEGMALGKAIISSNCPTGPREILDNGNIGILYPVGDFDQLAAEIEKLNENVELRKFYEIKGKDYIKKFDKNIIIKEIENMLLELK